MKVVIDVRDEVYNKIREGGFWLESGLTLSDAYDAIKNGAPLPKGHGDLIDREALKKAMEQADMEAIDYEMLAGMYEHLVRNAPSVIPADK